MTCYEPLHMLYSKADKVNKIIKYADEGMYWKRYANKPGYEIIKVPCGKCIGCRLDYASAWADRIMLEAKEWHNNIVINLTYDDDHLTWNDGIDTKTGELRKHPTLVKRDVQLFIKRLRKKYQGIEPWTNPDTGKEQQPIRFFMCGEYGDQKGRPHYHIIMFNFRPPDMQRWELNENGYQMYYSKEITKLWGMGMVKLNELTREMAEYIARYVTKKIKGKDAEETYQARGQVPEYTCMSRKPGIAHKYFEDHKETIYKTDEIFIPTAKGLKKTKPSKYFDKKMAMEDEEFMELIKSRRKTNANEKMQMLLKSVGKTEDEWLQEQKALRIEKFKALKRTKEATKIIIDEFGRRHMQEQ